MKFSKKWILISLSLILLGGLIMMLTYWASGFNPSLFNYHGTHEWYRTFYFN